MQSDALSTSLLISFQSVSHEISQQSEPAATVGDGSLNVTFIKQESFKSKKAVCLLNLNSELVLLENTVIAERSASHFVFRNYK